MAGSSTNEWIVVELTPHGEKEAPAAILRAASKILGRCEVYVPAWETKIGEDKTIHYLMPGYAFVRKERADRDYRRLEGTRLFQSLLRTGKNLATVASAYIEELKEKLRAEVNQGIGEGDVVLICSGPYKNIEATVITEIPEERTVQVHIELRSKQSIVTLPRSALKIVDRAPLSLYFARLGYLRAWFKMAQVVLAYRGDPAELSRTFDVYRFVARALVSGRTLFAFVHAYPHKSRGGFHDVHAEILARWQELKRIATWLNDGRTLFNVVHFGSFEPARRGIQEKFARYRALCEFEERLRALSEQVEHITRELARGDKGGGDSVMQNVLIDGHNLAFRCASAISRLTDGRGRPTGMILGFLRSLGALRKRFPEAVFWVAWDGSSRRRAARYAEYKAHRTRKTTSVNVGGEVFDPLLFLREILPALGVRQAWNAEEEADDVIATLVRGELLEQTNLICSTDRDFLQLVTPSTMFLYPAVGSRKEVLYDVACVEQQLGVPPERVVHLRALFGDTSDNLPGVPRVPKKVLRKLLQEHGTIDGIYLSGLRTLNKGQYERLMEAAPQVKLNREIMALVDVSLTRTDPDIDLDGAAEKLQSLDINADPILQAMLGRATAAHSRDHE